MDFLLSNGHLPLITQPTRIFGNSATLLDHITTTHQSDRYDAGIILTSISDHFPVYYIQHNNFKRPPPLNYKTRKVNQSTIPPFLSLLKEHDWSSIVNNDDPASSFEIFF